MQSDAMQGPYVDMERGQVVSAWVIDPDSDW